MVGTDPWKQCWKHQEYCQTFKCICLRVTIRVAMFPSIVNFKQDFVARRKKLRKCKLGLNWFGANTLGCAKCSFIRNWQLKLCYAWLEECWKKKKKWKKERKMKRGGAAGFVWVRVLIVLSCQLVLAMFHAVWWQRLWRQRRKRLWEYPGRQQWKQLPLLLLCFWFVMETDDQSNELRLLWQNMIGKGASISHLAH